MLTCVAVWGNAADAMPLESYLDLDGVNCPNFLLARSQAAATNMSAFSGREIEKEIWKEREQNREREKKREEEKERETRRERGREREKARRAAHIVRSLVCSAIMFTSDNEFVVGTGPTWRMTDSGPVTASSIYDGGTAPF